MPDAGRVRYFFYLSPYAHSYMNLFRSCLVPEHSMSFLTKIRFVIDNFGGVTTIDLESFP